MSHHTLSVKFHPDTVVLEVVCHEQAGALCRLTCAKGCECWSLPHEHEMRDLGYCNAQEWINSGDAEDACCQATRFPLHDGMPIEVHWDGPGVGYVWRPVLGQLNDAGLSAAAAHVRHIMMLPGEATPEQVDKSCVPFAKAILDAYFHEASQTVGPIP